MTGNEHVVRGKHRDEPHAAAERYGKHSQAHADVPVVEVLRRVVEQGEAIRLAWRDEDSTGVVEEAPEFPTAVLPVIRDPRPPNAPVADEDTDEEDTEPTTATRAARQWIRPSDFSWWPKALAG